MPLELKCVTTPSELTKFGFRFEKKVGEFVIYTDGKMNLKYDPLLHEIVGRSLVNPVPEPSHEEARPGFLERAVAYFGALRQKPSVQGDYARQL